MSRILFSGDLHLHPHKKSTERLQDCLEVLDWIFATAIQKDVQHIIVLGDLFHDRHKIDVPTYQKTFEIFRKYLEANHLQVHLLLGNHDLWHLHKWDISSVFPFAAIPNVFVIDRPSTKLIGDTPISFLPYTIDPITDLTKIKNDHDVRILCSHLAMNGATLNIMHGVRSEVSVEHDGGMVPVDTESFRDWNFVFLGHYHAAQKLDYNVEYIGSPLQLSFGEAFQHKHILIFDTKTYEKEYVRNTFSPQHFVIPLKDLPKYKLKDNFIKIVLDENLSAANIMEIRNDLSKKSVGSFEIIHDIKPQEQKQIIDTAKAILLDQDKMMEEYIKECRKSNNIDNLNDDLLFKVWKKITEKQHEES